MLFQLLGSRVTNEALLVVFLSGEFFQIVLTYIIRYSSFDSLTSSGSRQENVIIPNTMPLRAIQHIREIFSGEGSYDLECL